MKKLISIVIGVALLFPNFTTYAEPVAPTLAAPSAILLDARTGKVLFEKDIETPRFPASTTKIMTAILAIESGKLKENVVIPNNIAPFVDKAKNALGLVKAEELPLEELVYAMMLYSSNDAAVAVAQYMTGLEGKEAIEAFAIIMNERAKALGATATNFSNPNGLDNNYPDHQSTAKDLALIAKHAMTLPDFRKIVSTTSHVIPATNKAEVRDKITNFNKLLQETSVENYYKYAIGIKTGSTDKAGNCLVSAANKDGLELICVLLGAPKDTDTYNDTKSLFEYGFNSFTPKSLLSLNTTVEKTVKVNGGKSGKLALVPEAPLSLIAEDGDKTKISATYQIPKSIDAPVQLGEIIGTVTYSYGDTLISSINLLANKDIPIKTGSLLKSILILLLTIIVFLALWIGFIAIMRKITKNPKWSPIKLKKKRHK